MWAHLLLVAGAAFSPTSLIRSPNALTRPQVAVVPVVQMAGWKDPYEVRGTTKRAENIPQTAFDAQMKEQQDKQVKTWFGAFAVFLVVFGGILFSQIQGL
jgi:hypothetical protein